MQIGTIGRQLQCDNKRNANHRFDELFINLIF